MKPHTLFVCTLCASVALAQEKTPDPWHNLMVRGNQLDSAGDYAAAASVYRTAIIQAEATSDSRLPIALNALANAYDSMGRNSESEPLFHRALTVAGKDGIWNPAYGLTLSNLGVHYIEAGKKEKANGSLWEALAILNQTLPPDSIQLARTRNALANLLMLDRRYDEAEKLIEASLEAYRKNPEAKSDDLGIGLNNLGVIRRQKGRAEEALALFEESIHLIETGLSPDHPAVLRALANAATLYGEAGRHQEAEATFQRALSVAEKRLGASHPTYALLLINYALYLRSAGHKSDAKHLESRAHAILHDHALSVGAGMTLDASAFRH